MRAIACEEIGICYDLVERPPPWTKRQAGPSSSLRPRSAAHGTCPPCAPATRGSLACRALPALRCGTNCPRQRQVQPAGSYARVAANPPVQDASTCQLDAPGGSAFKESMIGTGQVRPGHNTPGLARAWLPAAFAPGPEPVSRPSQRARPPADAASAMAIPMPPPMVNA